MWPRREISKKFTMPFRTRKVVFKGTYWRTLRRTCHESTEIMKGISLKCLGAMTSRTITIFVPKEEILDTRKVSVANWSYEERLPAISLNGIPEKKSGFHLDMLTLNQYLYWERWKDPPTWVKIGWKKFLI